MLDASLYPAVRAPAWAGATATGDAIAAAARYLVHNGGDRPRGIANALYRYNNDVRYVRGVTRLAEVMQRDPAWLSA